MKYVVNEIQKLSNGDVNNITATYENLSAAESAYYTALANAVGSQFPAHIIVLMSNSGVPIKFESFVHKQ